LAQSGVFDPATLNRLVAEHQSRRRDHSAVLWALLMFDGFLGNHAERSAPHTELPRAHRLQAV
jgi:asparagine synthase (glutamine-hydrolysing)